jgi:uncharacterized protein YfaS (alpha-2-macroglobulin family)
MKSALSFCCLLLIANPLATRPPQNAPTEEEPMGQGLQIALLAEDKPIAKQENPEQVVGQVLDQELTERLLKSLPPFEQPPQKSEFAWKPLGPPPPKTAATVRDPFPPDLPASQAKTFDPPPLAVLRHGPEGKVDLLNRVSITFNQPMVPLSSLEEAGTFMAKLTPQPPGKWRWLDPRTLIFESEKRFPKATHYTLEVPAGSKSALGSSLEKTFSFKVETPGPQLSSYGPSGTGTPRRPFIWLLFDQPVLDRSVLSKAKLFQGAAELPLELVPQASWKTKAELVSFLESGQQAVVLWPKAELEADAEYRFQLAPGVQSQEGPLPSKQTQEFRFRTYGPLKVVSSRCGWQNRCMPGQTWEFTFSNPLENQPRFEDLAIETPLEQGRVWGYGPSLYIQGASRGKTSYRLTLPASLRDVYGQNLQGNRAFEFHTEPSSPILQGPDRQFLTLDPGGKPGLSLISRNYAKLRVRVYEVEPADHPKYVEELKNRHFARKEYAFMPPGRLQADVVLPTQLKAEEAGSVWLDLAPYLADGLGMRILWIEPQESFSLGSALGGLMGRTPRKPEIICWVQSTALAMDVFHDEEQLSAWVTQLRDGKPAAGVRILAPGGALAGITDAQGRMTMPLPAGGEGLPYLSAHLAGDVCLAPAGSENQRQWRRTEREPEWLWHTLDDRGLYQPGETISLKGFVRASDERKLGGLSFPSSTTLNYALTDPFGNEAGKGELKLSASGAFHLVQQIPQGANLGTWSLRFQPLNSSNSSRHGHSHSFRVQEFRRPEFELSCEADRPFAMLGEEASFAAQARYFAGGGLPGAMIDWTVQQERGSYDPPGWQEFHFGRESRWWWEDDPSSTIPEVLTRQGETDGEGRANLAMAFQKVNPPEPFVVRVTAAVTDLNQQSWSAAKSILVHPAAHCVGLRTLRAFVEKGKPMHGELVVTDLDGKPLSGRRVDLSWTVQDWDFQNGEWAQVEREGGQLVLHTKGIPVPFELHPSKGGTLLLTARTVDDGDRIHQTSIRRWISGGRVRSENKLEQQDLTLIADAETYQVGATASLLVQSPIAQGTALITLSARGMLEQFSVPLAEASQAISFTIPQGAEPNLHVQVDVVGAAPRLGSDGLAKANLPSRPAFASGQIELAVPALSRALHVVVSPGQAAMEPGGKGELLIQVRDYSGNAVALADCTAIVVDDALLALAGWEPNPLIESFIRNSDARLVSVAGRHSVYLTSPDLLESLQAQAELAEEQEADGMGRMAHKALPMAAMAMAEAPAPGEGGKDPAIRLRSDFNPLALFLPLVQTDERGQARVSFALPDNLTRYRILAFCTSGVDRFGQAESSLTARLPLMVRPSAPRFLQFGDRCELPFLLQNQTDRELEVELALRTQNLTVEGASGLRVRVPAQNRAAVSFAVKTLSAGQAEFQLAARSQHGKTWFTDAAYGSLPVWTPATSEAFALYGTMEEGVVAQPIRAPERVFPQFGGLELSTSSTALAELTDAYIYLEQYPFGCAEQIASRLMASLALQDVLRAFGAAGLPSPETMDQQMTAQIRTLLEMQNGDGGFPFWRRGQESWPYLTIHVSHALLLAEQRGLVVPNLARERALAYLAKIRSHCAANYGEWVCDALEAQALWVRRMAGHNVEREALVLASRRSLDEFDLESCAVLLMALQGSENGKATRAALLRHISNRAVETAGKVHFSADFGEGAHLLLFSSRRSDALIGMALMEESPQNELVTKVVAGLLAGRTRGRWANTQENVFALLFLDRYFRRYEAQEAKFALDIWLGERAAGRQDFRGRQTEQRQILVPMSALAKTQENLLLSMSGPGRLYWRCALNYAPIHLHLKPYQAGFAVTRRYEAVDAAQDVRQDEQGIWHVKAGATVRVIVEMTVPQQRSHVALVDPLPAGLEILNPELQPQAVAATNKTGGKQPYFRPWTWFQHQNMRNERAEAFASSVWPGQHIYSYFARATTKGHFVVPPAKAEEMYAPETFGRGQSDQMIVE